MSKKRISILLCLILSFAFVGCSQVKPEDSVKGYFEALKKQDIQAAQSFMQNQSEAFTGEAEQEKILNLIFSNLNYEIISSKVDEDTAIVKLKVTACDLATVTGNMIKDLMGRLISMALSGEQDLEAKSAQLREEYFTKALKDPQTPLITSEIDINLVMDSSSKKWLIVGDDNLANAITGNFVTAMKKFSEGFSK
jgi:hypothetical protein